MPDLHIKCRGETPYQYRYGDESEAVKLFIDGEYRTSEEAFKAWMEEKKP